MRCKTFYSKLFTPPSFLGMPAVSVEIQPHGISFLSTKNTESGLVPAVYGQIPLGEGVFSLGEIIKKEPVVQALVDIRKKTNVRFAKFSIPEEKTYTFKTHLPDLSPKEIRDILDFKIDENVPLSSKEAVFDYEILPPIQGTSGLDVVVSVAPLRLIEELQMVSESAGLMPVFFSPESNNVARAVIKTKNEQVIVIANIRETNIVMSLVVYGVVCQTSSINFGSSTFNDLLAKHFNVSLSEIDKIKKEKIYTDKADSLEIFSYLINTISAFKDELYKFVSYCNSREDIKGQVDRIILCGRDSLISGLRRYLSSNLGVPVDEANVWVNNFSLDDYVPSINRVEAEDLTVVNGLSLF